MIDPNKPIIDTRTTVVDEQPATVVPAGSGDSTPQPKQTATQTPALKQTATQTPALIKPAGSAVTNKKDVNDQSDTSQSSDNQSKKSALDLSISTDAGPYMDKSGKLQDKHDPMDLTVSTDAGPYMNAPALQERPDADTYSGDSYDTLLPWIADYMERHRPKSKEELEKEQRKQRTEGIISGISDAARAVANLFSTTQYAPNMYNGQESMTAKAKARFDKLKAEREAEDDKFFQYAMTYGKIKEGQKDKEYQHRRDALQDKIRMSQETRAQLKADRDAAIAGLKMELLAGRITEQEAAASVKRIEAEYADRYWSARVDEVQSRTNKNNRWQPSLGRSGGGGGGGQKVYGVFMGKEYYSKSDYDKAVAAAAGQYGVSDKEDVTSGTGLKTTRKQVKKSVSKLAAEIEKKAGQNGSTSKGAGNNKNGKPKQRKMNRLGL